MIKIYFAGSIRGGRQEALVYQQIIELLSNYGKVLTEHIANDKLLKEEDALTDKEIHDRDLNWLNECNIVVAEVTQPSLGVGYELATAMHLRKKVICLFNTSRGTQLSAMITGQPYFEVINYSHTHDLKEQIEKAILT